jgi:hypothetical protein
LHSLYGAFIFLITSCMTFMFCLFMSLSFFNFLFRVAKLIYVCSLLSFLLLLTTSIYTAAYRRSSVLPFAITLYCSLHIILSFFLGVLPFILQCSLSG